MGRRKRQRSNRAIENMEPMASNTHTAQFLNIDYDELRGSQECEIAAAGVEVVDEGLQFTKLQIVVPDSEIEKALCLQGQKLNYRPPSPAGPLTVKVAREAGYILSGENDKLIATSLPLAYLPKNSAIKRWMRKMQMHVYIKGKPSSTTTAVIQVLRSILDDPSIVLGHWIMAAKGIRERTAGSRFCLAMGHVLRNSPTYQELLRTQQGHNRKTRPTVQSNTEKMQDRRTVQRYRAESQESDAEDDTSEETTALSMSDDEDDRSEETTALSIPDDEEEMSEPHNKGDAPPEGAVEGSSMFRTGKIEDLLRRTRTRKSTPNVELIREMRDALKDGLDEVMRLTGEVEKGNDSNAKLTRDLELAMDRLAKSTTGREAEKTRREASEKKLQEVQRSMNKAAKATDEMDAKSMSLELEHKKLKVDGERKLATMSIRCVEKDGDFKQLKAAKEESDREVARLKEAEEIREREVEGLRSELERLKQKPEQKVLSDEFYNQRSITPKGKRAIGSAKRRRVESAGLLPKFVDDINKLTDQTEERVNEELQKAIDKLTDQMEECIREELQKELAELHSYRKLVEQTAREQFSIATTLIQPTDVTAEGYYQVMNLLVDSYRVAMGIAPIKLSNNQWVKLLEGLPTEGKEVLPRMLWEQRLEAEHPEVCNVLLGGLFNLHACHLMSAQEWAMDTHQRPAAKIIKLQEKQPIPGEEIGRWKGLATGTRNEVQQRRGDTSNFLDRVDEAEVRETQIIGARRMRWVFREAGWDAEGQLECPLLDKLEVPDWAIDYKKPPPARPLTSRV